jgi:hypothetical protein
VRTGISVWNPEYLKSSLTITYDPCIADDNDYGSEAWTIGKMDQKRKEAFETWCWRRMLKIK